MKKFALLSEESDGKKMKIVFDSGKKHFCSFIEVIKELLKRNKVFYSTKASEKHKIKLDLINREVL